MLLLESTVILSVFLLPNSTLRINSQIVTKKAHINTQLFSQAGISLFSFHHSILFYNKFLLKRARRWKAKKSNKGKYPLNTFFHSPEILTSYFEVEYWSPEITLFWNQSILQLSTIDLSVARLRMLEFAIVY